MANHSTLTPTSTPAAHPPEKIFEVKIKGEDLSITDVYEIAAKRRKIELDADQIARVGEAFDRVQEWGLAKYPVYGVNTGFGELIHMIVPPQYKSELQHNLIRSHAAGAGELFGDDDVRAIMTARLNCLMKGYAGIDPRAVKLLRELINRGICPVIPQQGSLGASGDLAPLSHMALSIIGEGHVRMNGEVREARAALAEVGLEPLELGFKGGLALINGTSAMTGVAAMTLVKAYKLLKFGLLASADFIQCLNGSTRPFDHRGNALKNHAGQIEVARIMRELLAESSLTREHGDIMRQIYDQSAEKTEVTDSKIYLQNAYSVRCMPQVLGAVLDNLNYCRRIVEEELNSCNDNPLIFETPEEAFHGANFHGQYVAMACDFLNISLTEMGVLAERQLNRLVDPHLNGNLPAFLADGDSGLNCGFEGGQYLATSIAAENLDLAAPASIKSIPSNGSNQDIVSMGLISARRSMQLCENVNTIMAVLVSACHQASHFVGPEKFNRPTRKLHEQLSKRVALYRDATPLDQSLAQVRDFLTSQRGWDFVDEHVTLHDETAAGQMAESQN